MPYALKNITTVNMCVSAFNDFQKESQENLNRGPRDYRGPRLNMHVIDRQKESIPSICMISGPLLHGFHGFF